MSMAGPGGMPLALAVEIRRMKPEAAAKALEPYLPHMTEDERTKILESVGKSAASTEAPVLQHINSYRVSVDPHRRFWLATAFLLGASHRMLANLHGVKHPSIAQSINTVLNIFERNDRLGYMLPPERITEYHKKYYENVDHLSKLTPRQAAHWLLANTNLDAETHDARYEG